MTGDNDVFHAARAVPLLDVIGGAHGLRRAGARLVGPCPICGGSPKSSRFTVLEKANIWSCFACPPAPWQRAAGGGAVELEQALRGGSAVEAARRLVGAAMPAGGHRPAPRPAAPAAKAAPRRADTLALARALWRAGQPAQGTLVEAWLRARGLNPAALGEFDGGLCRLRFHPAAAAAWAAGQVVARAPAMLAPVIAPVAGAADWLVWRLVGLHVTYLAGDGRAKARLHHPSHGGVLPARRMFGRVTGGCVPLTGPAGLGVADAGPLIVGEGVESTWAVAQRWAGPRRAVATLSLNNLQGGWLAGRDGALDLAAPVADPAAPPFVLQNAGAVIIAVDADMAPVTLRVRPAGGRGKPDMRSLTALDRARLCAALAAQAWRRAGASPVRAIRPRAGQDFNDAAMAEGVAA